MFGYSLKQCAIAIAIGFGVVGLGWLIYLGVQADMDEGATYTAQARNVEWNVERFSETECGFVYDVISEGQKWECETETWYEGVVEWTHDGSRYRASATRWSSNPRSNYVCLKGNKYIFVGQPCGERQTTRYNNAAVRN